MTAAEQASLEALRHEVSAGFAEMRGLMETRRLEEVRVRDNLAASVKDIETAHDARLKEVEIQAATNRTLIKIGAYALTTAIAVAGVLVYLIVIL